MKFHNLTERIVWDYDKGRSECPERWNDPLDYEKECEEHYMLTRGVEVDEEDAIYLFGMHLSSIDSVLEPPRQQDGYLLGKIKRCDWQTFLDKKNVMWTPTWYNHTLGMFVFYQKELCLSTFAGTPKEFYDMMMEE